MDGYIGLFSHEDAERFEILQLASSGCGVTALCNVLVALRIVNPEQAKSLNWDGCILRTRLNDAPLPQYLYSRSVAGCTGEDLVTSMVSLISNNGDLLRSQGCKAHVEGKFVPFADITSSAETFHSFLQQNLQQGKAMVALLNLQLLGNDAWHHQLIYGIDTAHSIDGSPPSMVYCVNPVCEYPVDLMQKMVSTQSVLLVRGEDVLKRHDRPGGDGSVYQHPDWVKLKVEEQIKTLVDTSEHDTGSAEARYVAIPANYVGGLAVFSRIDE